jgi:hypothetical protein
MNTNHVQKLDQLARRQQKTQRELISYFLPFSKAQICSDLRKLACAVQGEEQLVDWEVLSTFFTAEATKFLLNMPNRYWFWSTVEWAYIFSSERPNTLITLEAAERAVKKLRLDLTLAKFDLTIRPAQLSVANVAARVAAGIILVDYNNPDRIRFNPLFAPQAAVA